MKRRAEGHHNLLLITCSPFNSLNHHIFEVVSLVYSQSAETMKMKKVFMLNFHFLISLKYIMNKLLINIDNSNYWSSKWG